MTIGALKDELEKSNYANLFVDRGQNPDFVDRIKRRFNMESATDIIGFIDANYSLTGNEGVLITEEGIRWTSSEVTIDETPRVKGSLTYAELSRYSCSSRTKIIRNAITLAKRDIADGKNLCIEMAFLFNNEPDEKVKQQQVFALEKVFATLTSVSEVPTAAIPDEKNGELIEAFIGQNGNTAFYKKAFGKYSINGMERFAFCFSWGGFLFGAINLFYRKLYLEGVIWLIASAVLAGISSGLLAIIVFFAGAFVNPFLVYKKFRKILRQCNDQKMTLDQKVETLRSMGGPWFL
jgi:hypothetical protein